MNEPPLIARQREALKQLDEQTRDRAATETRLGSGFATRLAAIEQSARTRAAQLEAALAEARHTNDAGLAQARQDIPARADAARAEARKQAVTARRAADTQHAAALAEVQKQHDQARWEATTIHEATTAEADDLLKAQNTKRENFEAQLTYHRAALAETLQRSHVSGVLQAIESAEQRVSGPRDRAQPLEAVEAEIERLDQGLIGLERLPLLKLFRDVNFILIFVVLAILTVVPAVLALDLGKGLALGLGLTALIGGLATAGLYAQARRQVRQRLPGVIDSLRSAERDLAAAGEQTGREDRQRREAARNQHALEVRKAARLAATAQAELQEQRETQRQAAEEALQAALRRIERESAEVMEEAGTKHAARRAELDERERRERSALTAEDQAARAAYQADESRAWGDAAARWRLAMERWSGAVAELHDVDRQWFPDWSQPGLAWQPPSTVAPALKFGSLTVDRAAIPQGIPRDPRLQTDTPQRVSLPALLPFPDGGSLLIRTYGDGRPAAIPILQDVMLRALTCAPPGKVRFTIVDPVGLGQNFAAFMHLADHDENLVTSRIWTESSHIERKLADLTEHMEKVIQKYLRNEFGSIQAYNAQAGEVAEPFRFLVVANFPVNFSDAAARRLVSICQSGPRCGVYTLITVDEREPLPTGVTLADLEAGASVLAYRDGKFLWKEADFGAYPLTLEAPPPDEVLTPLLNTIGQKARDAARVEVPFEVVAPRPEQIWTADSRGGVDVPLGRVGANKLQYLRLGEGTSQHVLIAGRTGSGKSTLLHALIVNAALRYAPEELELNLIDFKKGVEFKPYVTWGLPHARIVAIESEREFGLSVLQRLDDEMRRRGELFRAVDVPGIAGYRDAKPGAPLPRILLIVDEFQEFFVEDDKLAQDAAMLLDRLVRQGRAFGIHVLLGSQTLGGAFSLARSTLGQMAVRIALQCSENDAHLILSEDNAAARLLSRPGEAIYNDANGLIEGNNFFQVVWLPDERREPYLRQVQELAAAQPDRAPVRPQIVFEGNIPADISRNVALSRGLGQPVAAPTRVPLLWLGDAVAIKDPTAAPFRRQAGANLLVVGQSEEGAMGMLLSGLASLAAQYPTAQGADGSAAVQAIVLDGCRDDSPVHGVARRLAGLLPVPVTHAGWREAGAQLDALAAELDQREAASAYERPPVFLFVHDLARFRDLRKGEDDYGFGSSRDDGEPRPDPARQFARILRDGPGYGIHTVVWCDSLNNLQRTLDRASQREFEMRVLFQMSPNDSSALIDSPAAGRLGSNRALFAHEEEGLLEKFRPYGIPGPAWWDALRSLRPGPPAADRVRS